MLLVRSVRKVDVFHPFQTLAVANDDAKDFRVPARHDLSKAVIWSRLPGNDDPEVQYVANLKQMFPSTLHRSVREFLTIDHGYLKVIQFPNALDRLFIDLLIYKSELGRPSRPIYRTTDFNFDVLENEIHVHVENPNSTKAYQRLNNAYWLITENPDKFPFAMVDGRLVRFPVTDFGAFLRVVHELGWDFY